MRLDSVEFATIVVSPWTEWTFARLRAVGEASADVEIIADSDVVRLVGEQVDTLKGATLAGEADLPRKLGVDERRLKDDFALATSVSALRTGVSIIQAVEDGTSLTEALGGEPTDSVPLYANINRGLFATQRTPSDFAEAAERTVGEGFRAVKCAPFDEVSLTMSPTKPSGRPGSAYSALLRSGTPWGRTFLSWSIVTVVSASFMMAVIVAEELGELGVEWFEEPVRPNRDPAASARIAACVPMTVAGGEMGYGEELFADLIENASVKVIMPDVIFCGGAAVAARSGRAAIDAGGQVSLHCPSGPVSLLIGSHVTASMPGAMPLEHAVYEADWRADLLTPQERVEDGRLHLNPSPGLGAELNWGLLRRVGRVWG